MTQIQYISESQNLEISNKDFEFRRLLEDFKASMKRAFHEEDKIDQFCSTRGIPASVMKEIMSGNPMTFCIPLEYQGFGSAVKKFCI